MNSEETQLVTVESWIRQAERFLPDSDSPRLDLELLLCHVLGRPRSWLLAWPRAPLPAEALARLREMVPRRAAGEPVAYLTGVKEFWSLPFLIEPGVLVPRPETECLVEQALVTIPPSRIATMIDLGTGSGAIAIAVARERPRCRVIAVDRSTIAIQLARRNAHALKCRNMICIQADWGDALTNGVADCVVANPPYIAADDPCLNHDGVRCEPRGALVAPEEGLAAIRRIAAQAKYLLKPAAWLWLEHGAKQGLAVRRILVESGFLEPMTRRDSAGQERITGAQFNENKI